jgi:hypothetical protein
MKKYLLIIAALFILFGAHHARAAIAFGGVVDGGTVTSTSTQTTSVTVTGTNPLLDCFFLTIGDAIQTATFNSTPMTKLDHGGTFGQISEWYATSTTGTHNVVATNNNPSVSATMCSYWTGVDQANPIDSHSYTLNTSVSPFGVFTASTTVNTNNAWVVGMIWNESSPNTITIATGTERQATTSSGSRQMIADRNGPLPIGSQEIDYNQDGYLGNATMDAYLISLKPAVTASGPANRGITLTGGKLTLQNVKVTLKF